MSHLVRLGLANLGLLVMAGCSGADGEGRTWVVEETAYSSSSLYAFPAGTSLRVQDDALVLSYRGRERIIPARISGQDGVTLIEIGEEGQAMRLMLRRGQGGRMEVVREGVYRLPLKEAGRS
jgi:hypothetical protein